MPQMYCSLGGVRVISLRATIPYYGIPVLEVTTDMPAAALVNGASTQLIVADLTIACNIIRTGAFAGKQDFFIIGGAGGWDNFAPAQAYSFPGSNVTSDLVLKDIALAGGETVNVASPVSLGPNFFREAGPASRTLKLLAGAEWWLDPSGITQVGPRTNLAPISTPFEVIDYEGARGLITISTENPSDWMPGRTFNSVTLAGIQTVTSTAITFGREGDVRLEVLGTP